MSTPAIPPLSILSATPSPGGRDPHRARDAAQQFEALLIGQMLRGVRESGSGWLDSGEDKAGDCATEFAEQQLALVMAQNGGLGLSGLIAHGLDK